MPPLHASWVTFRASERYTRTCGWLATMKLCAGCADVRPLWLVEALSQREGKGNFPVCFLAPCSRTLTAVR